MILALGVVVLNSLVPVQDLGAPWPDYRGPTLDGHGAPGTRPPLEWSEESNVRWKVSVPGRGWSSPVVSAGRIWLTTADPEGHQLDRKSTRLNSSHVVISYAVFCLKKKTSHQLVN